MDNKLIVGESHDPILELTDENNEIMDLEGASVKYGMKKNKNSAYAHASMPISGTASLGQASVEVSAAVTAEIELGRYIEEFEITLANGKTKKFQRSISVEWAVNT